MEKQTTDTAAVVLHRNEFDTIRRSMLDLVNALDHELVRGKTGSALGIAGEIFLSYAIEESPNERYYKLLSLSNQQVHGEQEGMLAFNFFDVERICISNLAPLVITGLLYGFYLTNTKKNWDESGMIAPTTIENIFTRLTQNQELIDAALNGIPKNQHDRAQLLEQLQTNTLVEMLRILSESGMADWQIDMRRQEITQLSKAVMIMILMHEVYATPGVLPDYKNFIRVISDPRVKRYLDLDEILTLREIPAEGYDGDAFGMSGLALFTFINRDGIERVATLSHSNMDVIPAQGGQHYSRIFSEEELREFAQAGISIDVAQFLTFAFGKILSEGKVPELEEALLSSDQLWAALKTRSGGVTPLEAIEQDIYLQLEQFLIVKYGENYRELFILMPKGRVKRYSERVMRKKIEVLDAHMMRLSQCIARMLIYEKLATVGNQNIKNQTVVLTDKIRVSRTKSRKN